MLRRKTFFCSSIVGQGVANGEKLNDAIGKAIEKSKLIVFLLSRDFLDSSYCMEELGAGWYLNQHKKGATCFYLVLPDMRLSDLNGFVNSKVDKFSFVDPEQKEELECFALETAKYLRLKKPEHQTIVNARKTFFSAIEKHLGDLISRAENKKLEEEAKTALAAPEGVDPELAKEVEALIVERAEAKKAKNYARADEIRKYLADKGITLVDSSAGTTYKLS